MLAKTALITTKHIDFSAKQVVDELLARLRKKLHLKCCHNKAEKDTQTVVPESEDTKTFLPSGNG